MRYSASSIRTKKRGARGGSSPHTQTVERRRGAIGRGWASDEGRCDAPPGTAAPHEEKETRREGAKRLSGPMQGLPTGKDGAVIVLLPTFSFS